MAYRGGSGKWGGARLERVCWGRSMSLLLWVGIFAACEKDEEEPYLVDQNPPPPEIPYERLPETTAQFVETSCPKSASKYARQCGMVSVPESPGSPQMIQLAVQRYFSQAETVAKDPIVYLAGGPGEPSLLFAETFVSVWEPLLSQRDLIFVDQRGAGSSLPGLTCVEEELGADEDQLLNCYEKLSTQIDLNTVTTAQSARDFVELRRALGYSSWNLLSISYGTRLALRLMQEDPEGVRAVSLDSVMPPQTSFFLNTAKNARASFEKVFVACEAQESCAEKYPKLREQFLQIVAEPGEQLGEESELGSWTAGQMFVRLLFTLLYSKQSLPLIPALIDRWAQEGGEELISSVDLQEAIASPLIAFGMHLSVQCAEELPTVTEEEWAEAEAGVEEELLPVLSARSYLQYCASWPVAPAPVESRAPVVSSLPTLLFSGFFDPVTPPAYAKIAQESLSNSRYFEFTDSSHGITVEPCAVRALSEFFADPERELSLSCLQNPSSLSFVSKGASSGAPSVRQVETEEIEFALAPPTAEELKAVLKKRVRFW